MVMMHHSVITLRFRSISKGLLDRNAYQSFVEYNTTVELVVKLNDGNGPWRITLRREEEESGYWWYEDFDAVLVSSGHYTVPFIPEINGLAEFAKSYPEAVEHSKGYRGQEKYRGKTAVVVGASVSGMDIAVDVIDIATTPITTVVQGKWHPYFGGTVFDHPQVQKKPSIKKIESSNYARTIHFEDGTSIDNVDHIILGTVFQWKLPFLPKSMVWFHGAVS